MPRLLCRLSLSLSASPLNFSGSRKDGHKRPLSQQRDLFMGGIFSVVKDGRETAKALSPPIPSSPSPRGIGRCGVRKDAGRGCFYWVTHWGRGDIHG